MVLKVYMPEDIHSQAATNREVIANIHSSFHKLRDVAERMAQRSRENSTDLLMFGKDLRCTHIISILNSSVLYSRVKHAFRFVWSAQRMLCDSSTVNLAQTHQIFQRALRWAKRGQHRGNLSWSCLENLAFLQTERRIRY